MFAIIATGGKQYRVSDQNPTVFNVERLDGDVGAKIDLTSVLMIGGISGKADKIGKPTLEKAQVSCEILSQERDDKIIVFKKNRRKKYRRTIGHRQSFTRLRVLSIKG